MFIWFSTTLRWRVKRSGLDVCDSKLADLNSSEFDWLCIWQRALDYINVFLFYLNLSNKISWSQSFLKISTPINGIKKERIQPSLNIRRCVCEATQGACTLLIVCFYNFLYPQITGSSTLLRWWVFCWGGGEDWQSGWWRRFSWRKCGST